MIRVVYAYLAAQHVTAQGRTPPLRFSDLFQRGALQPHYHVKDVRVRHSVHLSVICAILVVQAESPQILVTAIVAVSAALAMGALYTTGVLD